MSDVQHYETHFKEYVQTHDDVIQSTRTPDKDVLLSQIAIAADIHEKHEVLDCGSGLGYPAAYISLLTGASVTGVNLSPKQVGYSREKYGKYAIFRDHDFDDIVTLNQTYDRILFLESIGHTKHLGYLLGQCYRALNPGGLVYIKHLSAFPGNPVGQKIKDLYKYKFFPPGELVDAGMRAGFDIADVTPFILKEYDQGPSRNFLGLIGAADVLVEDSKIKVFQILLLKGEDHVADFSYGSSCGSQESNGR